MYVDACLTCIYYTGDDGGADDDGWMGFCYRKIHWWTLEKFPVLVLKLIIVIYFDCRSDFIHIHSCFVLDVDDGNGNINMAMHFSKSLMNYNDNNCEDDDGAICDGTICDFKVLKNHISRILTYS